jgi:acyl carrier protein
VEETLARLWIEVLGAERTGGRVSVHDHFFELGGHSLLIAQLVASIRGAFGVEIPLRALFERPTLEGMAAAVAVLTGGAAAGAAEIAPHRAPEEPVPLSFAQERLWLLDRIAPGTTAYNIPGGIRLHGVLDVAALVCSVQEIVRRQGSLRTWFADEEGIPVQRIVPFDPARPVPLPRIDLSALPEEIRDAEARRLAAEEAARPFDLATGPLFRGTLLRLAADEHVALYAMHHIVSDGWSMGVFFQEMAALYDAFAAGRPSPLPGLPLQYAGHARRQRARLDSGDLERGLAEWRRILDGVAPLELPADRPRPAVRSWRGGTVPFALEPAATADLVELARREGSTLFVAVLALFQALLHRLSGQEDIALGTVVANRTDPDVAALIGFFVNSLVLRTNLSGDPPVRELLGRARRTALEAFLLQEIPFERVVEAVQPERHTSRSPLFQVMLSLLNIPWRSVELPGLVLEPVALSTQTAKFDLSLNLAETPDGLVGELEHDLDLFEPATAARLVDHLTTLIREALAAPERRISELALLTATQRQQILGLGHQRTTADRRALPPLFEEQVDRTPEAPAVSLDGACLTYRDLDAQANRLARWLSDAGVRPGDRVALCLDRSLEMIVALLAVLKTGAAYLPLDPAAPRERLAFALEDSGAALVLATRAEAAALPETAARVVLLDEEAEEIASRSAARLALDLDPELPAYTGTAPPPSPSPTAR